MIDQYEADRWIGFLNSLLVLDSAAVAALVETRVQCNRALVMHPTVQVMVHEGEGSMVGAVGLLGLLNGFLGVDEDGYGPICAVYAEGVLVRFDRTSPRNG